jgi:hypothetical protein
MICKCCGEVKADWGNHRYCEECWRELRNEPKLKQNRQSVEDYYDNLGDTVLEDENGND